MMRTGNVNSSPSRVLYSKKKLKLLRSFQSATSVNEMLQLFTRMEKLFKESDLGFECWKLAADLFAQGRSPEQVLSFGNRALRIFIDNDTNNIPCSGYACVDIAVATGRNGIPCSYKHNPSLYVACICTLLAYACRELKRYDEALSYLNWAYRNLCLLGKGDGDTSCGSYCVLENLRVNQMELYALKHVTKRFDEAVIPLRKGLEIQERLMEEGCIELGKTYGKLSHTYSMIMNHEEALTFCLKTLEIYTKHLGCNSMEVAGMMSRLALIYTEFKEYEKALEHNQLSLDILKNTNPNSLEYFIVEGDTGYILVGLGRYEEAIDVLKRVVSHTELDDIVRGLAFVSMAKALYYLGKRAEAKKHMKTAQICFEKKDMLPNLLAVAFRDMSVLYESMNDLGKATLLLRKALNVSSISRKFLVECSARLFSLISLSGKEEEGIEYMKDVVEKLKKKFGAEHYEVGHGYRNLGATYLKLDQEHLAVKFMLKAKEIMDVTLGSHHLDSLKTSQSLAETYATVRSYDLAIEMQKKVVKGFKGLGPSEQENLDEAVSLLKKMEIAIGTDSKKIAIGTDHEDIPVKHSTFSVSEDRKII